MWVYFDAYCRGETEAEGIKVRFTHDLGWANLFFSSSVHSTLGQADQDIA